MTEVGDQLRRSMAPSPDTSPTNPKVKRGKYRQRQPKPVIPDSKLGRIVAGDLDLIPEDCEKFNEVDQLESPPPRSLIKVGTTSDQNSLGVFIMPFYNKNLGKVMVKQFHIWKADDNRVLRKDIQSKEVRFFDDVLDSVFDCLAAKSRWPTAAERKSARDDWLLTVWQSVTNEPLPQSSDASTAARKVRSKRKEADDVSSTNSKPAKSGKSMFSNSETAKSPFIGSKTPFNLVPKRPTGYTTGFLYEDEAGTKSPSSKDPFTEARPPTVQVESAPGSAPAKSPQVESPQSETAPAERPASALMPITKSSSRVVLSSSSTYEEARQLLHEHQARDSDYGMLLAHFLVEKQFSKKLSESEPQSIA